MKTFWRWLLAMMILSTEGCGTFVAHRIVQAPNTYPGWLAPKSRVLLGFDPMILTNFPARFVAVGPPAARLCYRVVEPLDYHLKCSSTNWIERGHKQFHFSFAADMPGKSNCWTGNPRGTVVLLHGYGLAQFAMVPWAIRLAEDGWRCVLVDLRGHGESTGKRVYFGLHEAHDLSQLLEVLTRDGQVRGPLAALGESYGAALSLRWKILDSRVKNVVAIAPYGSLSNAVLNICADYAGWFPSSLLRAGLQKLPQILHAPPAEFDTTTYLKRGPFPALFVAGSEDKVAPTQTVQLLARLMPESEVLEVPGATHEALTYFFDDLVPCVEKALLEAGPSPTR